MNRRMATLVVALIPIVVFGVLLVGVRVPFVAEGPGPTVNTLGQVDGKDVVEISGDDVEQYPTKGHLNMTTVSILDNLSLAEALGLWASGREQLVPRELIYPPGKSTEEVNEDNSADFAQSEFNAEYAALGHLKYPSAVTVQTVNDGGPSAGKLQPGDAIDGVDGKPVAKMSDLETILQATRPGQEILVDFRRKDDKEPTGETRITLGEHPERGHGFLGVGLIDAPWAPFRITFNLADVGGPSAGLMFSLAVVDKLTPGELNGGAFVAGSGTIDALGRVGAIGGIAHKILAAKEAGASVFLVPAGNCAEARSADDGLRLVRVETLDAAVTSLETLSAGGEPARC
ncbi:PDZ domain-containing protein [Mycobacterium sp. MYCO198283]|uniref:YlbL family protein n=1 Tax=Mycobacterium sp. MYCO198283 TaxID=2883505 RepID=UPI001E2EB20C|nr:PDZ domain-containing protein [Mycobacterium sp. MYCO198283]MCG5431553.1 PDZ domain-containing protein [Mycobacterium sp. MYCO198283]